MLIGVPKEIKVREYRVGLTPTNVREVVAHGHDVIIESSAGIGIGLSDEDYEAAGAKIVPAASDIFARADMVIKVKEPQAVERKQLRKGQVLFTYLHLAPDAEQTADLVESKATCIAYETVTQASGGLPLLAPMSEVAAGCQFRPELISWKRPMAVTASCLVVSRAWTRQKSSLSVVVSLDAMPPISHLAWAPMFG